MSAKDAARNVVAEAAAAMANRFDTVIAIESAVTGLSREEQEEAALSSLAYALARSIVVCGRTDEAAVHYLRVALAKNRSTRG